PCSVRAFRRSPGAELLLERADLLGGLREFRAEAPGLPDLKLVAEAGTGDLVLDAGVRLQRLGQDRPALAVALQPLARAVKRRRKLLALLRVRRNACDQRLDFPQQRIPSRVERGPVERRITIEAFEAVAREHGAERCRDRDSALGVEPHGVVRHEAVHDVPGAPPPVVSALLQCEPQTPALRGRSWGPHHSMGRYGLSWDGLGVKSADRPRPAL